MATLSEILTRRWPGQDWTLNADNYATLRWGEGNSEPQPSEAEILSHSAAVDAEIAEETRKLNEQNRFFEDNPDAVLHAIQVTMNFIVEVYRVLPNQSKNQFDAAILAEGEALKARIEQIRTG